MCLWQWGHTRDNGELPVRNSLPRYVNTVPDEQDLGHTLWQRKGHSPVAAAMLPMTVLGGQPLTWGQEGVSITCLESEQQMTPRQERNCTEGT